MKKLCLISVMVICGLFCFAHLGFCVDLIMIGYDANTSTLVGITDATPNNQFVSINFSTGLLTLLNSNVSVTTEGGGWDSALHTVSCVGGGTFYAIRHRSGNCILIGINTGTGVLTESPALHF
jgi:hypothetical protein